MKVSLHLRLEETYKKEEGYIYGGGKAPQSEEDGEVSVQGGSSFHEFLSEEAFFQTY